MPYCLRPILFWEFFVLLEVFYKEIRAPQAWASRRIVWWQKVACHFWPNLHWCQWSRRREGRAFWSSFEAWMLWVLGDSYITLKRSKMWQPQVLGAAWIFSPVHSGYHRRCQHCWEASPPVVLQIACALMSTIPWVTVTGCKTIGARGNWNIYRNWVSREQRQQPGHWNVPLLKVHPQMSLWWLPMCRIRFVHKSRPPGMFILCSWGPCQRR